jgi:hypothetical protein
MQSCNEKIPCLGAQVEEFSHFHFGFFLAAPSHSVLRNLSL